VEAAAQKAGAVAEMAAGRRATEYAELEGHYLLQLVAVKSLGPINAVRQRRALMILVDVLQMFLTRFEKAVSFFSDCSC